MTRQAYGAGSLLEREPGVWRLHVVVDGKQVQRTFRGTKAAAQKALKVMDGDPARRHRRMGAHSVTCWTSGCGSRSLAAVRRKPSARTVGRLIVVSGPDSDTSPSPI